MINHCYPTKFFIFYIRLFALLVFAILLYQAIRTTYSVVYKNQDLNSNQNEKWSSVVRKLLPQNQGMKAVSDDPYIRKLETYIFQCKPWHFPNIPNYTDTDTKKYAKLVKTEDLRLIPKINIARVDCKKIVEKDNRTIQIAKEYMAAYPRIENAIDYKQRTKNCAKFIAERRYITSSMTESERSFPVAYSMVVYKDVEMVERILRMIYRPQNAYCIHVDTKSDPKFYDALLAISKCFENVFIASRRIDVKWGTISIMLPDLVCMRDLLRYHKHWKYFINLTGQEFPIKNNFELVQVLRSLRGANDMESTFKKRNKERYRTVHDINGIASVRALPPVPLNITVVKGNLHVTASRGFCEFLLNDPKSRTFWDWVKNTGMPEETYFSTINSNPHLGAPGSYTGPELERYYFSREIQWYPTTECEGKFKRSVCINGVGDLKRLTKSRHLFLNKFHLDYEYLALDCYEQWFFNRTKEVYSGKGYFDIKPYYKRKNVLYALRKKS